MSELTEERLKRGAKNSKRLDKIVAWSLANKDLWSKLCYFSRESITFEDVCVLLDECKHQGFMEFYYLLLARVGDVVEINIREPEYIRFIKQCLSHDEALNENILSGV